MLRDLMVGQRTLRKWFAARALRRRFRKTTAYAIEALPEDTVGRITGHAQPFETDMMAPISGRRCVYWMLEVVEDIGEDWPSTVIVREERGVPFVLEQDGARAVIDPAACAVVSLAFDHDSVSNGRPNADALQRAVIDAYLPRRDWTHTVELTFHEAIIEVGEQVSVIGGGIREPDPEARPTSAYREAGATRLRLTGSAEHPLYITDDPEAV